MSRFHPEARAGYPAAVARVLLIGFSVTADRGGYAPRAASALQDDGHSVDVLGLGGLPVEPLVGHLRARLQRQEYDLVVLEIATSVIGLRARSFISQVIDPIYDLLNTIHEHGSQAAFVNLFRSEFDYPYHQFDMLVESIAARHRIPLLDLAAGLERHHGREFCLSTVRDVTHTTDEGAAFQAEQVTRFLSEVLDDPAPQMRPPAPQITRQIVPVASLVDLPTGRHERAGLVCDYARLAAGQEVDIGMGRRVRVLGVGALSHPRAGELTAVVGERRPFTLDVYYEASYYEHYVWRRLTPVPGADRVTLWQSPEIPALTPAKGEKDEGPREGLLVDLHVF